MIYWRCPICTRQRFFSSKDNIIIKLCYTCQSPMILIEDKTLEAVGDGISK